MFGRQDLETACRFVGVTTTFVATLLAAPDVWKHLALAASEGLTRADRVAHRLRDRLTRRSPRPPTVHQVQVSAAVGTAVATNADVDVWMPNEPVDARIERLRATLAKTRDQLGELTQRVRTLESTAKHDLENVRQLLLNELESVQKQLSADRIRSVHINARVIPPIGIGVLLTGATRVITAFLPVAVTLMALAVLFTASLAVDAARTHR